MDLIVETPRLAGPGETAEGTRVYTTPGGKGGNQAVAAAWNAGIVVLIPVGNAGSDTASNDVTDYVPYVVTSQGLPDNFLPPVSVVGQAAAF